MTDATLLVKDATGEQQALRALDDGADGLTTVHAEHPDQRDALLAALSQLGADDTLQAILAKLIAAPATETTLAAVRSALQGSLAITAAALPLPTGAATQTTLAAILAALGSALPLPNGAATQTTLASVLTALQGTLSAQSASRLIDVSFSLLTRPANTTAYAANDSISDNGTAGSVSALVAAIADLNDAPVMLTEMLLDTADTGLAAGVQIRAFLFRSDPTANSGVQAGDNAAYSNKRAGFIGSMSGYFRAFQDGGKARLVPDEGSYIVALPATGAKTIWVQYQALSGFTPSANSTTVDGRIKGFVGRV